MYARLDRKYTASILNVTHAVVLVNVPYSKKDKELKSMIANISRKCFPDIPEALISSIKTKSRDIRRISNEFDEFLEIEITNCSGSISVTNLT